MVNTWIVISIFVIHFFADFVCQPHWQAVFKSKKWSALLGHTMTYSLIFSAASIGWGFGMDQHALFWFGPITFVAHTVTDYVTSRVNARLWKQERTHDFFVSVGFDQLLHAAQLLLTYYLLT